MSSSAAPGAPASSAAADASSGRGLQMAVSLQLDALFGEYMSLYESLRAARSAAHTNLSEGFFSLTQARHALPSLALDSSAYSGRDMLPKVAWSVRELHEDAYGAVVGQDAKGMTPKELEMPLVFEVAPVELRDEDDDAADAALADDDEKSAEGVRQRKGAAAAAPVAAIASAAAADSSASAAAPAPLDLRSSPLQWFGVLTPPALSSAADSFLAALTPLAKAASLAQQAREIEEKYLYLSQLQQSCAVDPAAEAQLAGIMTQIKLSEERKRKKKEEAEAKAAAAAPTVAKDAQQLAPVEAQ